MAYAKRYAGGFVDKPTLTTPIDSTLLNAVEAALLALFDANPASAGMVPVWTPGGTHYVPQLLTNASIDPAAAIAKSKLANLAIADADVAGGAAISRSKLNFGAGLVDADIAAAAAIAYTKLNLSASIARTDMAAGFKTTVGTLAAGPPGSPTTGDVWIATAVDGNGTSWQFQYDSTQTTYKWIFIGGPPALTSVDTQEGQASNGAYSALATAGPSFTCARGGDYLVSVASEVNCNAGSNTVHSFDVGGTGALDADGWEMTIVAGAFNYGNRVRLKTSLAAATALVSKYKGTNTTTNTFRNRTMTVTPVRII